MPKGTSQPTPQQIPPHPPYMLPECATLLATLVEQMKNVSADLREVSSIIYGNGHTGLKFQAEENKRNIAEILKILSEIGLQRQEELRVRSEEISHRVTFAEERKKDVRKWWLGIAAAAIVAIIAIVQDIATQAALMKLINK